MTSGERATSRYGITERTPTERFSDLRADDMGEDEYNSAVEETRHGDGHYSLGDEPDLWADLFEAAARLVCNEGDRTREHAVLIRALQVLCVEVLPEPESALDKIERRHYRLQGTVPDKEL